MIVIDILIEILASMREVLIPFYVVLCVSLIAFIILEPLCRKMWPNNRSFKWLGILYHLKTGGRIRLACCWIKLILLITYLIMFQELDGQKYIMFLIPGLIYAFDLKHSKRIPGRIFWVLIETVGLFTASIVSGYIHDMRPGIVFTFIYIAIAIFLGLFGIYLFIAELDEISSVRESPIGVKNSGTER